jgi:hypothetical protein
VPYTIIMIFYMLPIGNMDKYLSPTNLVRIDKIFQFHKALFMLLESLWLPATVTRERSGEGVLVVTSSRLSCDSCEGEGRTQNGQGSRVTGFVSPTGA